MKGIVTTPSILEQLAEAVYTQLHSHCIDRSMQGTTLVMNATAEMQDFNESKKKADELLVKSDEGARLLLYSKKELEQECRSFDARVPSSGNKEELVVRILQARKAVLDAKQGTDPTVNYLERKQLSAMTKRVVNREGISEYISAVVKEWVSISHTKAFAERIAGHLTRYQDWRRRAAESTEAYWYMQLISRAIVHFQSIIEDDGLPVSTQAAMLSAWISALHSQSGSLPNAERDESNERKWKREHADRVTYESFLGRIAQNAHLSAEQKEEMRGMLKKVRGDSRGKKKRKQENQDAHRRKGELLLGEHGLLLSQPYPHNPDDREDEPTRPTFSKTPSPATERQSIAPLSAAAMQVHLLVPTEVAMDDVFIQQLQTALQTNPVGMRSFVEQLTRPTRESKRKRT